MKTLKIFAKVLALFLAILPIFLGLAYMEFYTVVEIKEEGAWIEISEEDYFGGVLEELSELDYIRNVNLMKLYSRVRGLDTQMKMGRFYLAPELTPVGAVYSLIHPDLSEISITIPEGFNKYDIDELLAQLDLILDGEYIDWSDENFAEGYIFPDTYSHYEYQFELDEFGRKAIENFADKVEDLEADIEASSYTLEEILIMASIIEKELSTPDDLPTVAGLFWKRLENDWPLQSDITVIYDQADREISYEDLRNDSDYNTYTRLGLPVGPISNPGLPAIEAALYPVGSSYWFFLTTPNGEVKYAETDEEHEANKRFL
jgi:UPF0755 protein